MYDAAQASFIQGRPFRETLAEEKEVAARLSSEQIDKLLDPSQHIGMCVQFAEREAAHAREVAETLSGT